MTISDVVTQIFQEADAMGIYLEDFGIYDEEDLTIRALNFLLANLDAEFDPDHLEMSARNPDDGEDDGFSSDDLLEVK